MEREELETRVNEELGSTKLTLSEQTISGELDDVLEDVAGDDDEANKKVITRLVNRLKRLDGNLHKDVSTQVNDWKKKNKPTPPKDTKKDGPDGGDEAPAWFKAYKAEQDAKWEAQEQARKEAQQASDKKAVKDAVDKSVRDKFKDAGITLNSYIYKQTMRDVEIPDEGADAQKIAKDVEKAYYKNLKEAGLDGGKGVGPRKGGGGSGGTDAQDAYFHKQSWWKEKHKGEK